jgi:hypothetical protein
MPFGHDAGVPQAMMAILEEDLDYGHVIHITIVCVTRLLPSHSLPSDFISKMHWFILD